MSTKVTGGTIYQGEEYTRHSDLGYVQDHKQVAVSEHTGETVTFYTFNGAAYWLWCVNEVIVSQKRRESIQ